ncbi:hypothetical protein CMI42_01365 [Candidatus Pacearchaeota archaeon]|nr:hypothetical protein [Candidatus Pacearchaeota archaeon]|tara:strand:+ start:2180 stop:2743 length:564 start_codon:yes stop_codon:yes gene_type:complete
MLNTKASSQMGEGLDDLDERNLRNLDDFLEKEFGLIRQIRGPNNITKYYLRGDDLLYGLYLERENASDGSINLVLEFRYYDNSSNLWDQKTKDLMDSDLIRDILWKDASFNYSDPTFREGSFSIFNRRTNNLNLNYRPGIPESSIVDDLTIIIGFHEYVMKAPKSNQWPDIVIPSTTFTILTTLNNT